MDRKITLVGVGSAVAMAIILLLAERFTTSTADSIDLGKEAAQKQLIEQVMDEKLRLDDDTTYGAALSHLLITQAVMAQQLDALSEE